MQGHHGADALGTFLTVLCLVFLCLSAFTGIEIMLYLAIAMLVLNCFRMLSKNLPRRQAENEAFLRIIDKPRKFLSVSSKALRNRKTTMYFKCESCKTVLSVPRGKGRIKITCPKCRHQTIRKS